MKPLYLIALALIAAALWLIHPVVAVLFVGVVLEAVGVCKMRERAETPHCQRQRASDGVESPSCRSPV